MCDVYSTGHFLSYVCVCGWSEDGGLRSGAVSRQTLFNKCLFALATTMCQVVWVFLNIVSTWPGVIIRIKLQSHPDKSTITHSRSHLSHTHAQTRTVILLNSGNTYTQNLIFLPTKKGQGRLRFSFGCFFLLKKVL